MIEKLKSNYISIGMIDNKLHLIKYDKVEGYSLMSITDDGNEIIVKTFGQLPDQNYTFYDGDDDIRFIYDSASESIVLTGSSEYNSGKDWTSTILSFSLKTGAIALKHKSDPNPNTRIGFDFAKTDTGVLLFTIQNILDTNTEVGKTTIAYINPVTLDNQSEIITLDYEFNSPVYVSSKNMLFGLDFSKSQSCILLSYDLTANNLKQISGVHEYDSLFKMFY